ncbi:hypothetical protein PsYK624_095230 [Phanerochaete sordida]|uniref:Fungal-type protein kinase domain-containing protein n=1 Tax=Phanerochaete sordida TaxID=48140 RepID=A0A9P3GGS4_9APHY|nr:hypothetical protein PsYK624_095230 [Phanerochaete sordida]
MPIESTLKLSTWGADLLEQVDDWLVEVTLDVFTHLLPGHDLSTEQLPTLPTLNFLKSFKDEHRTRDSLCAAFNRIEELAESGNRWKSIACIHSDCYLGIGSHREVVDHAKDIAPFDAARPLKRKRGASDNKESREVLSSKRSKLRTDTCDAEVEDCFDVASTGPCSDNALSDLEAPDIPCPAHTDWTSLISFVELKDDEAASGFHFSPARHGYKNPLLRDGSDSKAVRARSVKYLVEAQLHQHRTHFFTIYIAGSWVRVFRWDRVGCLVSPAIDLSTDLWTFYNILYRIARGPNGWGFDDTAILAAESDIQKLEAYSNQGGGKTEIHDPMLNFGAKVPTSPPSLPSRNVIG